MMLKFFRVSVVYLSWKIMFFLSQALKLSTFNSVVKITDSVFLSFNKTDCITALQENELSGGSLC
ncbi:MAG: hypothetical protein HQM10_10750 [Candidatus Riflebacteria bacterium]|nr:hypothetical protein [Candidatus Riflebacteria bacterium]